MVQTNSDSDLISDFIMAYSEFKKMFNKLWCEAQPTPPLPDFLTPVVWATAGAAT